jgi:hypothetical protein
MPQLRRIRRNAKIAGDQRNGGKAGISPLRPRQPCIQVVADVL